MAIYNINQISNFTSLYDTSRPFVFKYKGAFGTIKMLYRIQVEDQNGSGNWLTITKILVQDQDAGYPTNFLVDPSQICNDYIITTLPLPNYGVQKKPRNYRTFRLVFTGAQLNSNGTLDYEEDETLWTKGYRFMGIDAATQHAQTFGKPQYQWLREQFLYASQSNSQLQPLSNRPFRTTLCNDEHAYMDYIFRHEGQITIRYQFTHNNGTTMSYNNVINANTPDVYSIAVGYPELYMMLFDNGVTPSTILGSPGTLAEMSYKITYTQGNTTYQVSPLTAKQFVYKDCQCGSRGITIYWKNRKGGIDSYKFKGDFEEKLVHSHNTFQRALGYRRNDSEETGSVHFKSLGGNPPENTFAQDNMSRGKINIEANNQYTVFSEFLDSDTLTWLSEIYTSPRVWMDEDKLSGIFNATATRNDANDRDVIARQQIVVSSGEVILNPRKRDVGQIKLEFVPSNDIVTQRQ